MSKMIKKNTQKLLKKKHEIVPKLPKNSKNNQHFLGISFSEIIEHLLYQSIFNYLGNYFHEK